MSELPGFFEYLTETGRESSGMHSFMYIYEDQAFRIGDKNLPLVDFDPYTFNPHKLELPETGLVIDHIANNQLMIPSFGGVIAGPKLHQWIRQNPQRVSQELPKFMHQSYAEFFENPDEALFESSGGHVGFEAWPEEGGGVTLQVLGNCACLGVSQSSGFISEGMEKGFAQYELHNADLQAQRASLYAGLGHIARPSERSGIGPNKALLVL